jgi:hypothetical protein
VTTCCEKSYCSVLRLEGEAIPSPLTIEVHASHNSSITLTWHASVQSLICFQIKLQKVRVLSKSTSVKRNYSRVPSSPPLQISPSNSIPSKAILNIPNKLHNFKAQSPSCLLIHLFSFWDSNYNSSTVCFNFNSW